jgi:hypothetical protein
MYSPVGFLKKERQSKKSGGWSSVQLHYKREERSKKFSSFDGSQAVPARPSGKGTLERE